MTLTCYVLQAKGASEEKGCVHQRQETKHSLEWRSGVCVCVGVCVWVGVGGSQEAVFHEMKLHYKKFDIKKHGVFKRGHVQTCCVVVCLRWKVFDQSKLDFFHLAEIRFFDSY